MKLSAKKLGPLMSHVVEGSAANGRESRVEMCVVLCHGFGAPGKDLVGLARECFEIDDRLAGRVQFVFPEAPLALDDVPFGGRAWWPIDVMRLERALAARDVERLFEEVPEGLPAARRALSSCVDHAMRALGLSARGLVLGGFSQGAMLTTDLALRMPEAPAGLAILSGTLLARAEWSNLAARRTAMPVFISHGRMDPLLPFEGARRLDDLLRGAGLSTKFLPFAGGHGIDGIVVDALARFLGDRLPMSP